MNDVDGDQGGPRAGSATHAFRPGNRPLRIAVTVAGLAAAVVGAGLGAAGLISSPPPASSTLTTAKHITVTSPPVVIPLSDAEIRDLLNRSPDYGRLDDPQRRRSCLAGLGYPAATRVLGARPVEVNGRPGVLLVLPADTPAKLAVRVVTPNCNSADTGLIADTTVAGP